MTVPALFPTRKQGTDEDDGDDQFKVCCWTDDLEDIIDTI